MSTDDSPQTPPESPASEPPPAPPPAEPSPPPFGTETVEKGAEPSESGPPAAFETEGVELDE